MLDTTKLTMCNHYCLTIYLVTEQNERNEYELELNNIQWIVDSGCTRHTCSQRSAFTTMAPHHATMQTADGEGYHTKGIGTVGQFTDVYYMPDFKINLLSVSQLCRDGWTVTFMGNLCILDNDHQRIHAPMGRDELYQFKSVYGEEVDPVVRKTAIHEDDPHAANAFGPEIKTSDDETMQKQSNMKRIRDQSHRHTIAIPYSKLQHDRFGHAFIDRLKLAQKNKLIRGFEKEIKPIEFCEACTMAKMTYTAPARTPGLENITREYGPLGKIVCDIKGPFHIDGITKAKYYILFMCYVTKYKWIYFMKNIDADAFLTIFKIFRAEIKSIRGDVKILEAFKRDNAGCFEDADVKRQIKEMGTRIENTSPYTHHQAGLVERAHRTISEMGMSWLLAAMAPLYLWPYAYAHAVYISNMLPTAALPPNTTPYILLHQKVPDARHVKVWGCDMYALLYSETRRKFGPHAKKGIYVGQAKSMLAYLFYDTTTRQIAPTGHAKFNEDLSKKQQWTSQDEEELMIMCKEDNERIQQEYKHATEDTEKAASDNETKQTSDHKHHVLPNTFNTPKDMDDEEYIGTEPTVVVNTEGEAILATDIDRRTTREIDKRIRRPTQRMIESTQQHRKRKAPSDEQPDENESQPHQVLSFRHMALMTHVKQGEKVDLNIANEDLGLKMEQALAGPNGEQWNASAEDETKSLIENETWEITRMEDIPSDRTLVDNKWTFRVKINDRQELDKFKTRLVARGFTEVEGQDYTETFAPVARLSTFRMVLAISAAEGFHHTHIDIKTACHSSTQNSKNPYTWSCPSLYSSTIRSITICSKESRMRKQTLLSNYLNLSMDSNKHRETGTRHWTLTS